ncbi:hypothetical protein HYV31_03885 [candidate division WWE3 bacterium]|nr:hypothetical protein [candidate division WWE3 bacterium]
MKQTVIIHVFDTPNERDNLQATTRRNIAVHSAGEFDKKLKELLKEGKYLVYSINGERESRPDIVRCSFSYAN